MKQEIKFIVVHKGYAVFGTGPPRAAAVEDAVKWVSEDDKSIAAVESRLVGKYYAADGNFCILSAGDDEFDDYLENQGGFKKLDGKWYESD